MDTPAFSSTFILDDAHPVSMKISELDDDGIDIFWDMGNSDS